jgi:transposase
LDLRERVVKFLQAGGSKVEAARRFELARRTVYRYLAAAKSGTLTPKTSGGQWRKLDPQKLSAHVKKHPDATIKELETILGVSHNAVWGVWCVCRANAGNAPASFQGSRNTEVVDVHFEKVRCPRCRAAV